MHMFSVRRMLCGLGLLLPGLLAQAADWPHPVPARTAQGENTDLLLMGLGPVQTPLAPDTYDPATDTLTRAGGTVVPDYYRDELGVTHFAPIDKSIFPLPPSGWCTWYYYYLHINEDEFKRNAAWIAENLKDYGARVVQLDDGWQEQKRNWEVVDTRDFPSGMEDLARYVSGLGLVPGIWVTPHGQSSDEVIEANRDVFLWGEDGKPRNHHWVGEVLLDPTAPGAETYLKSILQRLHGWGYRYFKVDGQPPVVQTLKKHQDAFHNPDADPVAAYRESLGWIREVIGADSYMLGCWGYPTEGIGIMNGARTAGDVMLDWKGFNLAFKAALTGYHLHNIAWYNDPDTPLVRRPLPFAQARAWATLQGLSGLALMASDRLTDLSEPRVELLRRIYPAVDIRPLDLFEGRTDRSTWDLKVSHLGRSYDVLGLFNLDEFTPEQRLIAWSDLGLPSDVPVHVFDFWNQEYLGAWEKAMNVPIDPASCRVLTLLPDNGEIQLISTSRHITQGWVSLRELSHDKEKRIFRGTSAVVKNDPYELRFVFPRGEYYRIASARVEGLEAGVRNHEGWATLRFTSPVTGEVRWAVEFEPATTQAYPLDQPRRLGIRKVDDRNVLLRWDKMQNANQGWKVWLDGEYMGYTPVLSFPLSQLEPNREYRAEVACVWWDGRESKRSNCTFTPATGESSWSHK